MSFTMEQTDRSQTFQISVFQSTVDIVKGEGDVLSVFTATLRSLSGHF